MFHRYFLKSISLHDYPYDLDDGDDFDEDDPALKSDEGTKLAGENEGDQDADQNGEISRAQSAFSGVS